jgi:hypothetical protein
MTLEPTTTQLQFKKSNAQREATHLITRVSQRARPAVSAVVPALKHCDNLVEKHGAFAGSATVDFDLREFV